MNKTPPDSVRSASASVSGSQPGPRRTRAWISGALAAAAGLLALFGLGTLAAVLILALQGQSVAPWLVAAVYFALPLAFLLMAGLVISGVRRRRRG
ncbi:MULTISPECIES: hypothetical protein [unclassified Arthrobacter]|uniref:hypothetical protein n=1 Tax=unclassified Arthrobacter TaxID=235627 RepID=UPI001D14D64F|nr:MULTISPECIES: hypothetical protein [unclassified Arthrobacter]MCC3276673.1 hypothetical protein [Arthrobacter sp. zg-Y20]MCC3279784.1 hypothetical protein [Arthrobacter sp. zg-Y40]MCC9178454.1 hypothetical protein [Arthrobacter sp. zg-Y750]MDK1316832.1 hypothetical protein [Arthrobacter sp. zg.Y20]MDK1328152.1 hypothetical protein [Arthrobacter sp. zg-Y1143]